MKKVSFFTWENGILYAKFSYDDFLQCPYSPLSMDGNTRRCGSWCPHFGEIEYREDLDKYREDLDKYAVRLSCGSGKAVILASEEEEDA